MAVNPAYRRTESAQFFRYPCAPWGRNNTQNVFHTLYLPDVAVVPLTIVAVMSGIRAIGSRNLFPGMEAAGYCPNCAIYVRAGILKWTFLMTLLCERKFGRGFVVPITVNSLWRGPECVQRLEAVSCLFLRLDLKVNLYVSFRCSSHTTGQMPIRFSCFLPYLRYSCCGAGHVARCPTVHVSVALVEEVLRAQHTRHGRDKKLRWVSWSDIYRRSPCGEKL